MIIDWGNRGARAYQTTGFVANWRNYALGVWNFIPLHVRKRDFTLRTKHREFVL